MKWSNCFSVFVLLIQESSSQTVRLRKDRSYRSSYVNNRNLQEKQLFGPVNSTSNATNDLFPVDIPIVSLSMSFSLSLPPILGPPIFDSVPPEVTETATTVGPIFITNSPSASAVKPTTIEDTPTNEFGLTSDELVVSMSQSLSIPTFTAAPVESVVATPPTSAPQLSILQPVTAIPEVASTSQPSSMSMSIPDFPTPSESLSIPDFPTPSESLSLPFEVPDDVLTPVVPEDSMSLVISEEGSIMEDTTSTSRPALSPTTSSVTGPTESPTSWFDRNQVTPAQAPGSSAFSRGATLLSTVLITAAAGYQTI